MASSSAASAASHDYLHLASDAALKKVFGAAEHVLFSDTVTKINRKEKAQERTFAVTSAACYNLKGHKVQRRIAVELVEQFTISKTTDELVVHVPAEYDYHLKTSKRNELISAVNDARRRMGLSDAEVIRSDLAELKDVTVTKSGAGAAKRLTLTGAPLMGAGMSAAQLAAEAEAKAEAFQASDELIAPLGAIAEDDEDSDSD
jgi:Unconventional myosin tail, actin- and lipid-binding